MKTTARCWRAVTIVVLGVALGAARPAPAQSRLTLDDLGRIVTLRSPVISPDGKRIALIVSRPNFADNRHDAELVVIDVATRVSHPVMRGRAGLRDPVWVDNSRLGYLARPDNGGTGVQLFLRDLAVPSGRETQVTRAPNGLRGFEFSPDRASVAYLTDDEPPVRTGEERHNDSFEVGNDDFLTMAPPQPVHLWTAGLGGAARRLTSGTWSLATSLSTSPIEWSADGRSIAVTRFASPHSGDTDKSRIALVDASSGTLRLVADSAGRQSAPSISPDGKWIAFTSPRDGVPANIRDVMLVATGGGPVRNLTLALDRAVSSRWLPDGELLLSGNDETRMSMWKTSVDGQPKRLALGDVVAFTGISVASDGTVSFLGSERARPDELYVLRPGTTQPERITNYQAPIAALSLGRTEGLNWRTRDALTADGVVTYPPGYDSTRTHPLVLLIHGGPTAASNEGFQTRAQLFAARGWIVFQPNYRGSDNRGNAFQRAIADDPGPGIDADVMSGIALLASRGGVDTTRMAVSGWSFGGYVSAWLIGHHRHWKAAVVGAGAMDLFDMYALTDLNVQIRHAITMSPYIQDREEWFRAQSPLTYASRVRTPTLILHDVRDQRVTITQSFKLYHALKDNGVPVQFIAYPVAGHSPTDPVRARDVTRRWIDWLDRWLTTPTP